MNVILFDDPVDRVNLLPLTFTRPVAGLRTGILTIAEKWERHLATKPSFSTETYLQSKFPLHLSSDNFWINGAVCPTEMLVKRITVLRPDEGLIQGNRIIAFRTAGKNVPDVGSGPMSPYAEPLSIIDQPWKIFQVNGDELKSDFALVTAGRTSAGIQDAYTRAYAPEKIFLEEGVYLRSAILNAETGPIYLGKNSIVQEGAIIRGPFALGEGSHLNMGAKMRGNVSIGPFSKVGGEVSSSVIFGNSNKAHDGFLGCAVIGEWCNLGANTNNSNLKNNYENVKLWNYGVENFVDTGIQFVGLMMGDHTRCGINTMFNTGSVVGVSCNIYGSGFPRNFIPSFSWGGASGFTTFRLDKALTAARKAMERRSIKMTDIDHAILEEVFKREVPEEK